jgi:hypothetical protein
LTSGEAKYNQAADPVGFILTGIAELEIGSEGTQGDPHFENVTNLNRFTTFL